MDSAATKFTKLPGRGASLLQVTKLYLADDYLLQVSTSGFSERYHRFNFSDIQAVLIRKTISGAITNGILAVALFLSLILLVTDAWLFALVPAAAFGAGLIGNALLGPTCVTSIQTAVQSTPLPSLRRLSRAQKTLDRLLPLIESKQGKWSPPHASDDGTTAPAAETESFPAQSRQP